MSRAMEWTQAQTGIHSSIKIFIYRDTRCDTSGENPGFQGSKSPGQQNTAKVSGTKKKQLF